MLRQCPAYGKMCAGCGKTRHIKKVCQSRRDRAMNELEIAELQEGNEVKIETVSIDSVHFSKKLVFINGRARDMIRWEYHSDSI